MVKKTDMISRVLASTVWAATLILWAGQSVRGAAGSTTICKWKDNKQAVWTRSIDDNVAGQVDWVMSVVNPRGIKVTWYIITGLIDAEHGYYGTWPQWQGFVANYNFGPGEHEIGCHTVDHPCNNPCDYPADYLRAQMADCKARIEEMLPGNGPCITIAYPCYCDGNADMRSMARDYFISGRGTTGLNFGDQDWVSTYLFSTTNQDALFILPVVGETNGAIDATIAAGIWTNSYSHAIDDQPAFISFCDYVYSKRDVLWTGSERDVAQYIYERNAATVQVVSADQTQIVVNLTHSLPTSVCDFDFPLTLKTEVDLGWDSVTVVQGVNSAVVQAVDEAGTKYAYFDAQPNKGNITLTPGAQTAIRDRAPENIMTVGRSIKKSFSPNPVKAGVLYEYLRSKRNAAVCDLAGKTVDKDVNIRPGLYLVTEGKAGAARKVLVVK